MQRDVRLADGLTLAVRDQGQGPPLLLVHGFPLDHTMWQAQFEPLARQARVITPDLRGFGHSTVVPGVAGMERLADDLAALLVALEVREPVVFCGLSMGGYVAWQFWRRQPERLRALVLCDTRAQADSPEARAAREKMIESVERSGASPVVEAMVGRLFAASSRQRKADEVAAIRRVMESTPPQGMIAALRGMLARPDTTAWLPQIDVPTLVIVGQEDVISTVEEMRSISCAIPGAELVVLAESGHMTPVEQPEAFNAAVAAFLSRLP